MAPSRTSFLYYAKRAHLKTLLGASTPVASVNASEENLSPLQKNSGADE